ncbi:amidohydrolase family protein [Streptococcus merionis]|uniref:amidohydrolase family protein n=1 Tax=Streptococcus merionis TaxID=400065 RepID=UPI0026EE523C|nr:amidohydrolase family protein [Streptococcus merionis]
MVVDANIYWFDEAIFQEEAYAERFLAEVPRFYQTEGAMKVLEDGRKQIVIEKPAGYANINYIQGDYILEKILENMDVAGIERGILKLPCYHEWLSLELCKKFNDGMADFVRRSKGRLRGLGVVPPRGSQAVKDEIDRCLEELSFTGLQMVAHYGEYYLDDDQFADFFAYVNSKGLTIYVHHTPVPVDYSQIYEYNNVRRSYGRNVDQGTAVMRELFSGFFDKYPNLKLVHSMLGGGVFAFKNLILPKKASNIEGVERFQTDHGNIVKHLKENLFFELSHSQPWGKDQLEAAVKILGADHLIYGSSYPVRLEWLTDGPDFVRELAISEEEKELILGGNAKRLYRL